MITLGGCLLKPVGQDNSRIGTNYRPDFCTWKVNEVEKKNYEGLSEN